MVIFSSRNTNISKHYKRCKAMFSTLYSILSPNFVNLLIAVCVLSNCDNSELRHCMVTVAMSRKLFICIGVKSELQTNSNRVFAMIEQNISFKSIAIKENLIKPSRFLTFQHLSKPFVRHAYSSPREYILCLHEMFIV